MIMINSKNNGPRTAKRRFMSKGCWQYSMFALCGSLILAGCSSSNTPNYYSLTPQIAPVVQSNQVRVIEVLPVGLSDRLNRIPLVIQTSKGESKVLNEERWTSTLSAELRDSLSAGLQQKLGAFDRYNSGMTGGKAAYRIAIDFSSFDFIQSMDNSSAKVKTPSADQVVIAVAWTVKYDDPNRPLSNPKNAQESPKNNQLSCRMQWTQPIAMRDPKLIDAVETSRQSLAQVIDGISTSVLALERKSKPSLSHGACN